jgi:hypothetical protein
VRGAHTVPRLYHGVTLNEAQGLYLLSVPLIVPSVYGTYPAGQPSQILVNLHGSTSVSFFNEFFSFLREGKLNIDPDSNYTASLVLSELTFITAFNVTRCQRTEHTYRMFHLKWNRKYNSICKRW